MFNHGACPLNDKNIMNKLSFLSNRNLIITLYNHPMRVDARKGGGVSMGLVGS